MSMIIKDPELGIIDLEKDLSEEQLQHIELMEFGYEELVKRQLKELKALGYPYIQELESDFKQDNRKTIKQKLRKLKKTPFKDPAKKLLALIG